MFENFVDLILDNILKHLYLKKYDVVVAISELPSELLKLLWINSPSNRFHLFRMTKNIDIVYPNNIKISSFLLDAYIFMII